jgi:xanthine dehydrogenase accessory factor
MADHQHAQAAGHAGVLDPSCEAAHGGAAAEPGVKALVAVFASPVASFLMRYAADAGYQVVLVEPDPGRAAAAASAGVAVQATIADGLQAARTPQADASAADVVVTDHHRDELGAMLRDALASPARWVGIMGSPRHEAPHLKALAVLGVPDGEIGRVHRPIGLNIGSKTPPEIAIATLAGLIADRNGCPGGLDW